MIIDFEKKTLNDGLTFRQRVCRKAEYAKDKVVDSVKGVVTWCKENPEAALGAAVIIVPNVINGVEKITKRCAAMHEVDIQNHRVWDPRTMEFIYTTKDMSKMSAKTKAAYQELLSSGVGKYDALKMLGYVK